MAKNDDVPEDAIVLDIEELKQQLGLPDNTEDALVEMDRRFSVMNTSFGELLIYMNKIDERVQALAGEPVITTTIQQHVGNDGSAQLHRSRPAVPAMTDIRNPQDLAKNEETKVSRMIVNP